VAAAWQQTYLGVQRNSHTGGDFATEPLAKARIARITVMTGPDSGTELELPRARGYASLTAFADPTGLVREVAAINRVAYNARVSLSELPPVVIDEHGVPRFNGRTANERLADLDRPAHSAISVTDRRAEGLVRAGKREGTWRYSINGEAHFVVEFVDDRPVALPPGWIDDEWPGPSLASYRRERMVLETFLREYRRPEDVIRIYLMLLPEVGNSIPVIRGLMDTLGVSLTTAKMALDDACQRAKRG
jgi:hypothetical protein